MKTSSGTEKPNVISMADYRRKQDVIKQRFRDSLDNSKVMEHYRINEPTIEERQERIKESIERINKLMRELGNKCST